MRHEGAADKRAAELEYEPNSGERHRSGEGGAQHPAPDELCFETTKQTREIGEDQTVKQRPSLAAGEVMVVTGEANPETWKAATEWKRIKSLPVAGKRCRVTPIAAE
jgi:hypothetical protein